MSIHVPNKSLASVLRSQTAIAGSVALGATAYAADEANAIVVETEIGIVVADGTIEKIDVNGDGRSDLKIFAGKKTGSIQGIANKFTNAFTSLKIARDGSFFNPFQPGDSVSKTTGPFSKTAKLYEPSNGPLSNSGDTAYVGLEFFEVLSAFDEETEEAIVERNRYYGWLELTRGSVTVGTLGLQNVSGAAAPIPNNAPNPVPIPPGIALMAAGAMGLAAVRRRKKAA